MLDFVIALNKTGVMFYNMILNQKYNESFYVDLTLMILKEIYIEQKTL